MFESKKRPGDGTNEISGIVDSILELLGIGPQTRKQQVAVIPNNTFRRPLRDLVDGPTVLGLSHNLGLETSRNDGDEIDQGRLPII